MNLTPAQKRLNLLLFIGLALFAIALCATVLLWMRGRTREQGGKVYPPAVYQTRSLPAGYADFRRLQREPGSEAHPLPSHLRKSA